MLLGICRFAKALQLYRLMAKWCSQTPRHVVHRPPWFLLEMADLVGETSITTSRLLAIRLVQQVRELCLQKFLAWFCYLAPFCPL